MNYIDYIKKALPDFYKNGVKELYVGPAEKCEMCTTDDTSWASLNCGCKYHVKCLLTGFDQFQSKRHFCPKDECLISLCARRNKKVRDEEIV